MIAGLVSALGLAGTAALLLISMAQTSAARDRTIAEGLATNLSESIQLSPGDWDTEYDGWRDQVAQSLPGGAGLACRDATPGDGTPGNPACDKTGPLVIKLFWDDLANQSDMRHVLVVPL
jgi:hypothetical protein